MPRQARHSGRPCNSFHYFEEGALRQTVRERFAEQVGRFPEHLAVKLGDEELTYRALTVTFVVADACGVELSVGDILDSASAAAPAAGIDSAPFERSQRWDRERVSWELEAMTDEYAAEELDEPRDG